MTFLNSMSVTAARTATSVNYEAVAGGVGIFTPTVKHWLSILVSSGLVALIQPYSNHVLERATRAPWVHFLDIGLCTHLTRWSSPETLERGTMDGQFFKTWVVSEIYKSYLDAGKQPPLYFYRGSNKEEIGLLIHEDGILTPIEIKKSFALRDAIKNFSVLIPIEKGPSEEDIFPGTVYLKVTIGTDTVMCMPVDMISVDEENWYIPA